MLVENLSRQDLTPHKDTEQYFQHSWTLAVETNGGVVGIVSDENQLHLIFPKHTDAVLSSVPPHIITRFGTELEMAQVHPEARKHLNSEEARDYLMRYSDPDLRKLLRSNGISFEEQPYVQIDDELIMSALEVERSKPVKYVEAIAVGGMNYKGELKDSDKPLVKSKAGQTVAYHDVGERQFAKFHGAMERSGGRVWVDFRGAARVFPIYLPFIDKRGRLSRASNNYNRTNTIDTFPWSLHNIYAPEAPNADPEAVSKYRDRFINLAAEVAIRTGKIKSVSVTPDEWSRYTPEELADLGFEDIRMLDTKYYWGREQWKKTPDDIVLAKRGDRVAALIDTGKDQPSWITTISRSVSELLSPASLAQFMQGELAAT